MIEVKLQVTHHLKKKKTCPTSVLIFLIINKAFKNSLQ